MATQVQFRRGTTAETSVFTGADGEVTVDTTKKTCVVHDGFQVSGYPLLREDGSNSAFLPGGLSSCALKFVGDPNTGIFSPGSDQIGLVTGGVSRLLIDSSGSVTIPGNVLVGGTVSGAITFDDGSAAVPAIRFTNDPNTGIYSPGADQVAISTNGTGRLFVDSSGRVGVGTSSPSSFNSAANQFVVGSGSGSQGVTIYTGNSAGNQGSIFFADGTTGGAEQAAGYLVYEQNANYMAFGTLNTERMRLDSSGRLGLGTSSPTNRLEVNGAVSVTGTQTGFTAGALVIEGDAANTRTRFLSVGPNASSYTNTIFGSLYSDGSNYVERMRIDASGNIAIGTTPSTSSVAGSTIELNHYGHGLVCTSNGDINFVQNAYYNSAWLYGNNNSAARYQLSDNQHLFFTAASGTAGGSISWLERVRIDSSGRLLVGTSTAVDSSLIQTAGGDTARIRVHRNIADVYSPILWLSKARGTGSQAVANGDELGGIYFQGADGSNLIDGARVAAQVDGTPGANDMPTRLVFSTTSDGASSPTERMRITSSGHLKLSNTGSYREASASYSEVTQSVADKPVWLMQATSGSYAEQVHAVGVARSANTAYNFFTAYSGDGSTPFFDLEFRLNGGGNGTCDGSWTGGGADYAEYFEWSDGNPDEDDRRGISVVLDGEKIRPAVDGEDPIGVISGNPSVVGDAAWNKWIGKYLRDDYGTYIQEDYDVVNDEGETIIQQRRKLNPAYDPDQEYTPREQRPEWDCVGLMGKLRIRKGQPTGSRWIKMRDVSDSVEEWLVR